MFVGKNVCDIEMWYCLTWQLGSFLFGPCRPKRPRQVQWWLSHLTVIGIFTLKTTLKRALLSYFEASTEMYSMVI